MKLLDLVAVYNQAASRELTQNLTETQKAGVAAVRDAVLAEVADRLLPELPEGWRLCFVDWERYEGMEREYVARVERIEDEYEYRQAFGPTIPAAIANALQEGSADE